MIQCYFCKTTVPDVEAAIAADWIPSFYDEDREIPEPVCPACTLAKLHLADDGEFELAEHIRYADEAESAQRGNAWPQAAALWQMAADKCTDANCREGYEKNAAWCREMICLTKITEET